jgi:hypothetical protein
MRQILTPDQRVKLNAMRDRGDRERRDRERNRELVQRPPETAKD